MAASESGPGVPAAMANYARRNHDRSHVTCRFFAAGNCHRGDNCSFYHDFSTSTNANSSGPGQGSQVCKYFLKGNCMYGDRCRNSHSLPLTRGQGTEHLTVNSPSAYRGLTNSHGTDFPPVGTRNAGPPSTTPVECLRPPEDPLVVGERVVLVKDNEEDNLHGSVCWIENQDSTSTASASAASSTANLTSTFVGVLFDERPLRQTGLSTTLTWQQRQKFQAHARDVTLSRCGVVPVGVLVKEQVLFAVGGTGGPRDTSSPKSGSRMSSAPRAANYAEAVAGPSKHRGKGKGGAAGAVSSTETITSPRDLLCPWAVVGQCMYAPDMCQYTHGMQCDMCDRWCLHPFNKDQRDHHRKECLADHEKQMEEAFAEARSRDKTCGVCMEVIKDKTPSSEARFGILPSCNHVFCLTCIRKWRQAKVFENKIVRSCPECRTTSDFVIPSWHWVEEKEDKKKLLETYHKNLSKKPCKYFDKGKGKCPFGGNCFYQHKYPDGSIAKLPPPKPQRRRLREDGNLGVYSELFLWHFFQQREDDADDLSISYDGVDIIDYLSYLDDAMGMDDDEDVDLGELLLDWSP